MFKVLNEAEPARAPLQPAAARAVLPPDTATLARTQRAAGYVTGISGKWHVARLVA